MSDAYQRSLATLLIGESGVMRRIRDDILRCAPTALPILVQGPTGSGKELAARAVHLASRRTGAMVAFNVCALSDGMFEDAMFGHVKGAFTGASQDSRGYLAEANGGSVFLDEISGLGLQSQSKLLRALETGVFRPVGGTQDRVSNFRLISASNEDLQRKSEQQRFRADLLHRIGGWVLELPRLRDRVEDIPLLARHFLAQHGSRAEGAISEAAIRRLQDHAWLGNIRELRHAIERAVIMASGDPIERRHVDNALQTSWQYADVEEDSSQVRERLAAALEQSAWDISQVALTLNVHRATVYRWMTRFGLRRPSSRRSPGVPGVEPTSREIFERLLPINSQ